MMVDIASTSPSSELDGNGTFPVATGIGRSVRSRCCFMMERGLTSHGDGVTLAYMVLPAPSVRAPLLEQPGTPSSKETFDNSLSAPVRAEKQY